MEKMLYICRDKKGCKTTRHNGSCKNDVICCSQNCHIIRLFRIDDDIEDYKRFVPTLSTSELFF